MNRQHSLLITSAMCVGFLMISCHKQKQAGNNLAMQPLQVEAFITKAQPLENSIQTPGSILPNEEVVLKTEIPGRIVNLNFREGKIVSKGTLLVQIDDSEPRAELRKYQAQLQLAVDDESRKKELLSMRGVSQEVYDLSLSRREELLANIDLVNTRIRKSKIIAPFDGTIGLRYISEGAYISSGDVIATLVQTNPVRIEFSVPEKYASMVYVPMEIQFVVAASEELYTAAVYAIEPMIDPGSRTLKVRARTANTDGKLVPGSFADLTIKLQNIPDAILVPTQVIIPALNSQNVYVVNNNQANFLKVETGIQTSTMIQISKGISAGDTVIMTGILALKDKMPVIVSKVHSAETEK